MGRPIWKNRGKTAKKEATLRIGSYGAL